MKYFLFLLSIIITTTIKSQPAISWQRNIGGTNTEYANAVDTTLNGSMYTAGAIRSTAGDFVMQYYNAADYLALDAWIVKYDQYGNLLWQKVFGGGGTDEFFDVKTTLDGGAIAVGRSYSTNGNITNNKGGEDVIVAKYDADGNLEWNQNYGSSFLDGARTVIVMPDGSYVLNCYSNGNNKDFVGGKGLRDVWLMQISSTGAIMRRKNFGGTQEDDAYDLIPLENNCWAFAAQTGSLNGDVVGSHGNTDVWVVKLDSSWNIVKQKCFGGASTEYAYSLTKVADGFVIASRVSVNGGDISGVKGGFDMWLVKTDDDLNLQWAKTFGGSANDNVYKIITTADGQVLAGGETFSTDGDISSMAGISDAWLVKVDPSTGAVAWSKTYGSDKADYCKDLLTWGNNDFLFAGMFSTAGTQSQLWIATSKFITAGGTLPVRLLSFDALQNKTAVKLEWQTSQEINTKEFIIERSNNGIDFTAIGTVKAKGNSTVTQSYSFTDDLPFSKSYYRLRMVDLDNRQELSKTIRLQFTGTGFKVYPAIATSKITVAITAEGKENLSADILDVNGRRIKHENLTLVAGANKKELDIEMLAKGNYFLRLNRQGANETIGFIKL